MSDKPIYRIFQKIINTFGRNHSFAISFICGCCLSLLFLSISPRASAEPMLTIDVMNPQHEIDYAELDKFVDTLDKNKAKSQYSANTREIIILSDVPVKIIAKALPKPYYPVLLADLGIKVYPTSAARNVTVYRLMPYKLASKQIRTVQYIPPMYVPPRVEQPVVVVTAMQAPSAAVSQKQPQTFISSLNLSTFWLVSVPVTIILMCLLLLQRSRKTPYALKTPSYTGKLGAANEMIGSGKLFDFNGNALNCELTPINTNYLNMLWHVGKFSNEGAVNTYFYMAFYIPPQQNYAASLQKHKKAKVTENDINA